MTEILAWIAGLLAIVAGFFGLRSRQYKAERDRARERAAAAEGVAETHRKVNEARDQVDDQHREEDADAAESVKAGDRDHLDKPW